MLYSTQVSSCKTQTLASSYILEEQTRQKHQSVLSSCILGLTSQTPSLDPYKTSPKRLQRLNQRYIDGYYKDRIKSISMVSYDKALSYLHIK